MVEVVVFSLLGGALSLLGAILLFRDDKKAQRIAYYATPFAAGVLLAAAFYDLLPEAIDEYGDANVILLWALFGILLFFMLEKFIRWFHHHHEEEQEGRAKNSLIIIGDTLHNALDGIAIGAAFLINVPTGIVAALAVAAHEIPQEIGDFGLLLKNGMKRKKVLMVNAFSALATTVAAVVTYWIGDDSAFPVAVLPVITAGFFIYIAASDIIPEIHEGPSRRFRDIRPWLLLLGAVFIIVVSPIAHTYIDSHHDDSNDQDVSAEENSSNHGNE